MPGAMETSGRFAKAGMEPGANQRAPEEEKGNEDQPRKNLSICVER
jgi:hypothetical protein